MAGGSDRGTTRAAARSETRLPMMKTDFLDAVLYFAYLALVLLTGVVAVA